MDQHARRLADAIKAALPGWVERSVARFADAGDEATAAGRRATAEIGPRIRALLETDVDEQRTNPLAILRTAVRYPTEVLRAAGVPPVARDADQERLFPDDVYDLTPANFADLGPEVGEAGLMWGAAKAHEHLKRRRPAPKEQRTK